MDLGSLRALYAPLCLFVAAPALLVVGIYATVALRAPQLRWWLDAFRALNARDDEHAQLSPALTVLLTTAAVHGAALALSMASAVLLSGPGAIPWLWIFCFVFAGLRAIESIASRTNPPGRAGAGIPGSLAQHLFRAPSPFARNVGLALAVVTCFAAVVFVGGAHGEALRTLSRDVAPGSTLALLLGLAACGAALALAGPRRAAGLVGWLAAAGLLVLLVAASASAFAAPARALNALVRACSDVFRGVPDVESFSGALAGEVLRQTITFALPSFGASVGLAGPAATSSRASTVRQAKVAMLEPLAVGVLGTLLAVSYIVSGAYFTNVSSVRPFSDVTVYQTAFETASQRREDDRLFEGYLRIQRGASSNPSLAFATDRGIIQNPRFQYWNGAADLAIHVRKGRAFRLMRPRPAREGPGGLVEIPMAQLENVHVLGDMLPTEPKLFVRALAHGPLGAHGANLALAALLVLVLVTVAAWGWMLRSFVPTEAPAVTRGAVALLPAFGVALTLSPFGASLVALAPIAAVLVGVVGAVALGWVVATAVRVVR